MSHEEKQRPQRTDAVAERQQGSVAAEASSAMAAYLRAPNEDDDGYDPYSDRPATAEPLFEPDPWN
jgi:hypothetical protein